MITSHTLVYTYEEDFRQSTLEPAATASTGTRTKYVDRVRFVQGSKFPRYSLLLTKANPDLRKQGFNNATSSIKVSGTPWILYQHINYEGAMMVYQPGNYPKLGSFNDIISSARPLPSGKGVITLFEHINYGGRMVVLTSSSPDFRDLGFNDRVSSLIVIKGVWTGFQHIKFEGNNLGTYAAGTQLPMVSPNDTMSSIKLD